MPGSDIFQAFSFLHECVWTVFLLEGECALLRINGLYMLNKWILAHICFKWVFNSIMMLFDTQKYYILIYIYWSYACIFISSQFRCQLIQFIHHFYENKKGRNETLNSYFKTWPLPQTHTHDRLKYKNSQKGCAGLRNKINTFNVHRHKAVSGVSATPAIFLCYVSGIRWLY